MSTPSTPGPEEELPPLLTVTEVARMLRLSKMTVYRMIHDGRLPAIRIGRAYRVPEPAARAVYAQFVEPSR
ncbi:helix-turn-helix domain-containing protein [Streptomonospora litoralis]|uniref:Helix-turn-helix domain protein n=1 Tax=Streptomonospora litoralis TaxID=2498135 RepID=A0A4P6Q817_9ACTN|nr:helix-turn-helix domain-containing protein [Streptomonospora litoralis]QBI56865.1 Helix-turn-helix domain protein [Streptomonospora litoralis]